LIGWLYFFISLINLSSICILGHFNSQCLKECQLLTKVGKIWRSKAGMTYLKVGPEGKLGEHFWMVLKLGSGQKKVL
jgi:hypothetical protein